MRTRLIPIGNSKGIIIPSRMLEHCAFVEKVSLEIKNHTLVISNFKKSREGWKEAFEEAGARNDGLLMDSLNNGFDKQEWSW